MTLPMFDADIRERWADHEAHFTPLAVALQGVESCARFLALEPDDALLIVDVGAGAGSIGMALRQVFPHATLVAVEPREEEVMHLRRHYDEVFVGTVEQFAAVHPAARFDLAISNPRWSMWGDIFDATLPLVKDDRYVVMHGPSSWGHSDEPSEYARVFDEHLPIEQWRVRGRVAYNGGAATDNRKVSWWAWKRFADEDPERERRRRHGWRCITLPALEAEARRWRVRPGTEMT